MRSKFEPINIPVLDYSYYLNQGYERHKSSVQLQDAEKCYNIAITLRPYRSEAYYNRSLLMIQLKRSLEALKDIKAAISSQYLNIFVKYGHENIQNTNQENKKNYNKKLLLNSIKFSSNNFLSINLLQKYADCQDYCYSQANKSSLKGYQLNSIEKKLIIKSQSPIYPANNFRLNGIGQSQQYALDKQIAQLLQKYHRLCSVTQNYQRNRSPAEQQVVGDQKTNKNSINNETFNIIITPKYNYENIYSPDLLYSDQNFKNRLNIQRSLQNLHSSKKSEIIGSENRYGLSQIKNMNINCEQSHISVTSFEGSEMNGKYQKFCHNGCSKCNKIKQNITDGLKFQKDCWKIQIKTVQIYRSQILNSPKPYLIFMEQDQNGNYKNQVISEVDYMGGYFPKWASLSFYLPLKKDYNNFQIDKQNKTRESNACKIQLWNKDSKNDVLIGSAKFVPKSGRFKCQFTGFCNKQRKKRHTGYIFLQIKK